MVCGGGIKGKQMKKLMIGAFAMVFAVAVNAASYSWSIPTVDGGEIYAAGGESSGLFSGSGYMFELNTIAPTLGGSAGIFDLWQGGQSLGDIASTYGGQSVSLVDGATAPGSAFITDADIGNALYVLVLQDSKGNVFYDQELEASWDYTLGSGEFPIDASWTADSEYTFGKGAMFESPGWYAVPEPTSGLLLLIGVAGLALRRRRA